VDKGVIEHLEELRRRILICCASLFGGTALGFFFVDSVRDILTRPAGELTLVYTRPPEAFLANIRLAFISGLAISIPVIIYQLLAFVTPGLHKKEKRVLIPFTLGILVFFAAGVTFAYYVVFRFALTFFLGFSTPELVPMLSITEYISFTTQFLLGFGIVFQLPLLFLLLGSLGVISAPLLRRVRKYVIVVITIISAVLTPPDVISQLLMAGPLFLLYELGILLVAIGNVRRRKRAAS